MVILGSSSTPLKKVKKIERSVTGTRRVPETRVELDHAKDNFNSFREVERSPTSAYNKLGDKDRKLIRNFILYGMSLKDAVMDAYELTEPNQVTGAITRLKNHGDMQAAMSEAMDACKITDAYLANVLKRGLEAKKTYYDKEQGELVESAYDDHESQHKFLRTALELRGALNKKKDQVSPPDEDNMINSDGVHEQAKEEQALSVLKDALRKKKETIITVESKTE